MDTDDLVEDECWRLLAASSFGRIALSVNALPTIVPVEYSLEGRRLTLYLCERNIPHSSLSGVVIAFAVDTIDEAADSGWTVQVRGVTRQVATEGGPTDPVPPGAGQVVHFEPFQVVGHHFTLGLCIDRS